MSPNQVSRTTRVCGWVGIWVLERGAAVFGFGHLSPKRGSRPLPDNKHGTPPAPKRNSDYIVRALGMYKRGIYNIYIYIYIYIFIMCNI